MNKGRLIGWTIVILIGTGIGGFFLVRSMVRASKLKPFKEDLAGYLEQSKAPGGPGQGAQGAVKGKLITVDMDDRDFDYIYFDLPDDLRPDAPAEVGTVVQLKWAKQQ